MARSLSLASLLLLAFAAVLGVTPGCAIDGDNPCEQQRLARIGCLLTVDCETLDPLWQQACLANKARVSGSDPIPASACHAVAAEEANKTLACRALDPATGCQLCEGQRPDAAPDIASPDAAVDVTSPDLTADATLDSGDDVSIDGALSDTTSDATVDVSDAGVDATPCTACVRTLAGDGSPTLVDGPLLSASFAFPEGVAIGATGAIYVADSTNNAIRVIAGGTVSTIAGGTLGFKDGPVAVAQFHAPSAVAVDSAGNIYVADRGNHRVRLISAGQVTTLAGTAVAGLLDGAAAASQLRSPNGVAVDGAGNVYVADWGNSVIRLISGGQVSTFAGSTPGYADGAAASAKFLDPKAVALDSAGALYVVDSSYVRVIVGGVVSTVAGGSYMGFQDGSPSSALFFNPSSVAVNSAGAVFIGDTDNHRVRVIYNAAVSTLAGGGNAGYADGPAATAQFFNPRGVAVNSAGDVVVVDEYNHRIRVVVP